MAAAADAFAIRRLAIAMGRAISRAEIKSRPDAQFTSAAACACFPDSAVTRCLALWAAFEEAYRGLAKLRAERMKARLEDRGQQQSGNVDPIERLQNRADAMLARATALKHLADTASPLYQSLDDGQKHRFIVLSHLHEHHRMDFDFGRERRGEGQVR
jgi:hypothetical protein